MIKCSNLQIFLNISKLNLLMYYVEWKLFRIFIILKYYLNIWLTSLLSLIFEIFFHNSIVIIIFKYFSLAIFKYIMIRNRNTKKRIHYYLMINGNKYLRIFIGYYLVNLTISIIKNSIINYFIKQFIKLNKILIYLIFFFTI